MFEGEECSKGRNVRSFGPGEVGPGEVGTGPEVKVRFLLNSETEQKRTTRGARGINRIPKGLLAGRLKEPALVAPVEQLIADVRAIRKAPLTKMSNITLKYLKDTKVISGDQYAVYRASQEKPEDRKTISEFNTIEHVNLKLLEIYEKA